MSASFEIQNLTKLNWDMGAQGGTNLFSSLSAEITTPERIALIGASGQGKSTLLRILALLDTPDAGDVLLNGTSIQHTDPRLWRMAVAYVAQQAVMLPGSVEDNLRTVSSLHRNPYDSIFAAQLMERLGLEYLKLGKKASDCSGGEKQRISLIRSLMLRPSILLLDEITASLDINSTLLVERLLMDWHLQEGTSFIWVTHDLEQAHRISNRTWILGRGVLQEHSSDSLFKEPAAVLAQMFIQPVEGSLQL